MLDLSLRYYRGGAAPRNWHRDGELLGSRRDGSGMVQDGCSGTRHGGTRGYRDDPDNHLEEKAAAKTDKDLPDKDLEEKAAANTHTHTHTHTHKPHYVGDGVQRLKTKQTLAGRVCSTFSLPGINEH